jgi:site-specific DNA-methyltransferase (adenine-specific)
MVSQLDLFPETLPTQQLIHDDCINAMKQMADNSIDFVVCDPPYMINFMNKNFDKFKDNPASNINLWKQALRICKPGSMLAAFGGDRTHHHLMMALENAGWEIRTCLYWIFGSGFPKSYNIGKHIEGFEGYGTALKPAVEIIVLAMKPCDGTFSNNAQKWGLSGINIDESRIQGEPWKEHKASGLAKNKFFTDGENPVIDKKPHDMGRWPANLILDEEAAEMLDQQTGILKSGKITAYKRLTNDQYSGRFPDNINTFESSSGGASRFFYCAKASPSERNIGLEDFPVKQTTGGGGINNTEDDVCGKYGRIKAPQRNCHPTVKPISLMKYILNLLAPPGNPICLDPFMGSGTTGIACKQLNINFIGIEKELEYFEIAKKRIENGSF